MTTSRGMVVVSGVTYRIIDKGNRYEIVRVLDDLRFGSFQRRPALELGDGPAPADSVVAVAQEAMRLGKLRWAPTADPSAPTAPRSGARAKREWERALSTFIASLLARLTLWRMGPFARFADLLNPSTASLRTSSRAHEYGMELARPSIPRSSGAQGVSSYAASAAGND